MNTTICFQVTILRFDKDRIETSVIKYRWNEFEKEYKVNLTESTLLNAIDVISLHIQL